MFVFALVFLVLNILHVQCVYNEAPCLSNKGRCLLTSGCPSVSQKSGLCPSQAYNVKCCIPYNENACSSKKGRCQWNENSCSGQYSSGLCPTQAAHVRCCVPNSGCPEKYTHALQEIFRFEGKCQNFVEDRGNYYDGTLGYTCMGITPGVGWDNKGVFDNCGGYNGHAALFVKYCYDRNPTSFKKGVEKIYTNRYLSACDKLADPAFFVCADIAVNSGTGRVKSFMTELGTPGSDLKDYARRLNELHRAFYEEIAEKNPDNQKFLDGWLRRADHRDTYIDNYTC